MSQVIDFISKKILNRNPNPDKERIRLLEIALDESEQLLKNHGLGVNWAQKLILQAKKHYSDCCVNGYPVGNEIVYEPPEKCNCGGYYDYSLKKEELTNAKD